MGTCLAFSTFLPPHISMAEIALSNAVLPDGNDDDDKGRVNDPDDTLNGGILDFLLHFYLSPDRLRLRGNLADVVMMSTMRLRMMLVRMEVMTVMMVMDAILPTSVFMSNSPRPWM